MTTYDDIYNNNNNVITYDVSRKIDLKNKVIQKLISIYGADSEKNITRYFDKRYDAILNDLARTAFTDFRHEMFKDDEDVKMYLVSEKRNLWGQITINGSRKEAVDLLLPYFAIEVYKGSQGIAKAIKLRETTMDALMELAVEEAEFTNFNRTFSIPDDALYFSSPINVDNLRNYIDTLVWRIKNETDSRKQKKLINEKMIGTAILTSLNDRGELDQEATIADSGRIYFKGLNLLNAPKNLRHAALGTCHLYDMRVGAFGVMAGLASTYASRNGLTANFNQTRGYIKHKDEYRMKITQYVYPLETKNFKSIDDYKKFFGFYNVKIALTSIGFGAKRNSKATWKDPLTDKWKATSLVDAFKGNKAELERFLECPIVKALTDEYVEASNIVLLMLEQDATFAAKFNLQNADTASKKAALVYQHMEQELINAFVASSKADVLLPAHDGVYVKHAVDYISPWSQLKHDYIDDMLFVQFDHTKYIAEVQARAALGKEMTHEMFTQEQERIAQDYQPLYTEGNVQRKKQVQTPWGLVDADLYQEAQTDDTEYFKDTY